MKSSRNAMRVGANSKYPKVDELSYKLVFLANNVQVNQSKFSKNNQMAQNFNN